MCNKLDRIIRFTINGGRDFSFRCGIMAMAGAMDTRKRIEALKRELYYISESLGSCEEMLAHAQEFRRQIKQQYCLHIAH